MALKNYLMEIFSKSKIVLSNSDISSLKAYNAEIKRGVLPMTAYYKTMQEASDTAVNVACSAGNATVNIEQIATTSKAATIATKALCVVGNMMLCGLLVRLFLVYISYHR